MGLIRLALFDFVVPVMYLRGTGVMAAWREFRGLLAANPGSFILYVLFKIVIALAVGTIACVLTCATCCLAALPYVGTVIMLPLIIFNREYSLYFLEQFGPAYRVISTEGQSAA